MLLTHFPIAVDNVYSHVLLHSDCERLLNNLPRFSFDPRRIRTACRPLFEELRKTSEESISASEYIPFEVMYERLLDVLERQSADLEVWTGPTGEITYVLAGDHDPGWRIFVGPITHLPPPLPPLPPDSDTIGDVPVSTGWDDLEDARRATLVELVNTTGEQHLAITSVIAWLPNQVAMPSDGWLPVVLYSGDAHWQAGVKLRIRA